MSVVIPSLCMINQYWNWYVSSETVEEDAERAEIVSEDFLRTFLDAGYILYNQENGEDKNTDEVKEILRENGGKFSAYERIYPFLEIGRAHV